MKLANLGKQGTTKIQNLENSNFDRHQLNSTVDSKI
jgi:hypothetical protein